MVEKLVNSASVLTSRICKVSTCFQKSSYLPWRLKFGHLGASGYQIYFSVYRVAHKDLSVLQMGVCCMLKQAV